MIKAMGAQNNFDRSKQPFESSALSPIKAGYRSLKKWPLLLGSIMLLSGCFFKSPNKDSAAADLSDSCDSDTQPHPRYFKYLANYCPDKKPGEPLLLAYVPTQSIESDVLSELFNGTLSSVVCAPGPVLLNERSHAGIEAQPWVLEAAPSLLLWYQEGTSEANESFYIMDPSGFPLKAKAITLAEKNEFVIALAPLGAWAGAPHFIYLKQAKKDEPQNLWMQPIKI